MRAILATIAPELEEMDEGTRDGVMRDIRAIYEIGRFGPEELRVRAGGGVSVAEERSEGVKLDNSGEPPAPASNTDTYIVFSDVLRRFPHLDF